VKHDTEMDHKHTCLLQNIVSVSTITILVTMQTLRIQVTNLIYTKSAYSGNKRGKY
jgi:hypothetical protein